jgi:hypothetical protein
MNKPQAELIIRNVDISTLARRRELANWLKDQADQLNKPKQYDAIYRAMFMNKRGK